MKFEDLYYEEITVAAYQELLRVGRWFSGYSSHREPRPRGKISVTLTWRPSTT